MTTDTQAAHTAAHAEACAATDRVIYARQTAIEAGRAYYAAPASRVAYAEAEAARVAYAEAEAARAACVKASRVAYARAVKNSVCGG